MGFRSRLVRVESLDRDRDSICVVNANLQVIYCNPVWDAFAMANGGTQAALGVNVVGHDLMSFLPEVLRPFFATHLHHVLTGMGLWRHDYECSSPDEFRIMRLEGLGLPDAGELLLCHELVHAGPHYRMAAAPGRHGANGAPVRMCCGCRCVLRADGSGQWEWVPEYLAHPPERRIDELCEICSRYYNFGRRPWPQWD